MAGARLEKIGTIFTRVTGLLNSGAMKPQDKPLWYDIYEAFPPKYEPRFDRPPVNRDIPPIFYPEDVIRANFYKKYGSTGTINLSDRNPRPSLCQRFVQEYQRFESEGNTPEDKLMEEAALTLEAHGIYLDKSRAPPKETKTEEMDEDEPPRAPKTVKLDTLRLAELFKESQDEK
ncbi:hypothetical protein Pcinc_025595 [Petrolisthes cinctipes]|uniref:Small ribosomal subunit protein mS23 n=1 Tax=Petrolisthes cinctipes TaxID=88211 RepID=A0AAE1F888_PETCI|nr:hypothetical protein Pcinc_025595 [Petrolisthes cinctipes]